MLFHLLLLSFYSGYYQSVGFSILRFLYFLYFTCLILFLTFVKHSAWPVFTIHHAIHRRPPLPFSSSEKVFLGVDRFVTWPFVRLHHGGSSALFPLRRRDHSTPYRLFRLLISVSCPSGRAEGCHCPGMWTRNLFQFHPLAPQSPSAWTIARPLDAGQSRR